MGSTASSPDSGPADRRIFPLSRLAKSIEAQLERSFHGTYWITAEISKLNHYPQSGHCYPQLVEKQSGKIVAEFRAFILHARYRKMDADFREVAGKPIADGMQILFRCKVGYHPIYGLSLQILDIEPSYTLGEMSRMRSEAIRQLRAEGLFDKNKSLPLPSLLRRIAVISVETSKGWQDFQNTLDQSSYAAAITTHLFPSLLQGDAAVKSIGGALERIQSNHTAYDAVCIIRGGGGETGLDCYDSYALAEKVCRHPLPVITGIGHASNLTVVEQVAHHNLITPTALARFVIEGFEKYEKRIDAAAQSLKLLQRTTLIYINKALESHKANLSRVSKEAMVNHRRSLERDSRRFEVSAKKALELQSGAVVHRLPSRLIQVAKSRLKSDRTTLSQLSPALPQAWERRKLENHRKLNAALVKTTLLDPAQTLKRGYSITFVEGRAVTDVDQLKEGDTIRTRFANGSAESTVKKTDL